MVAWTEWDGNTLLMHAASTGSAAVFKTVYGAFRDNLSAEEVTDPITARGLEDASLEDLSSHERHRHRRTPLCALCPSVRTITTVPSDEGGISSQIVMIHR